MADAEKVKPVALLPVKRRRLSANDWDACLFCQQKDCNLKQGSNNGIKKVQEAYSIRKQHEHTEILERLTPVIDELEAKMPKWHTTSCYATFCSKTNLTRLQKRSKRSRSPSPSGEGTQPARHSLVTRRVVPGVNWNQCIFCQKRTYRCETLHQVLTSNCANTIHNIAKLDENLNCKIAALDLIAYEVKYHSTCLLKWSRDYLPERPDEASENDNIFDKAFTSLVKDLDGRFEMGHIYTLSSLTKYYQHLLSLEGYESNYSSQKLKDKLCKHYGNHICYVRPLDQTQSLLVFPNVSAGTAVLAAENTNRNLEDMGIEREMVESGMPNDEEMFLRAINLVSSKVKSDIHETQGHQTYEGLDEEHARAVIPNSLYMLLQLILTGADGAETEATKHIMTRVLGLAQDIVFAASNGKKLTPKHIGLGLAVHQATRSKSLVQLLHACIFIVALYYMTK